MRFFALPNAILLHVCGRDSVRYLGARLTNDIKALQNGSGCLAGALTAQGRTQGYFAVYRLWESEFLLTCDGGDREGVISAFRKFIVADQVEVTDLSSSHGLLHLVEPSNGSGYSIKFPTSELSFSGGISLGIAKRNRGFEHGYDIIAENRTLADHKSSFEAGGASEIEPPEAKLARIKEGIVSFPEELNESMIFSEAPVRSAISFSKGCYVGQEVIERVDALGKTARTLRVVELEKAFDLSAGDSIEVNGISVGKVISFALDLEEGRSYCFALVKNDPGILSEPVTVRGIPGTFCEKGK